MSDVASRPAPTRGRGTTRGRGGFRGAHRSRQANGDHGAQEESDQGELGEMKKKYASQLKSLRELFSEWSDVDLLFALEETDGDLERTIDHISEGNVSQFSDVKKKTKDRSRSKVKEAPAPEASTRAPRGRGVSEHVRGRGRGGERGGRGRGVPRGASANVEAKKAAPSAAWGDANEPWDSTPTDAPRDATPEQPAANTEPEKAPVPATAAPPQNTWAAKLFQQPKPAPPKFKPVEPAPVPVKEPSAAVPSSDISSGYVEISHDDAAGTEPEESTAPTETTQSTPTVDESTLDIPPSKDKLTEDNVEHLPDASGAAPIGTAASTVDSSRGFDSTTASVVTPAVPRPAVGGYAAAALKATQGQARSASFQRRLLEQQEAVVMPGKHAVDRTAVQFGSLGLNGDGNAPNVDEEREEAETRPQPPQQSPVAPRAALPPAPKQQVVQEPTIKPAPGLPAAPQKDAFGQQSAPIPVGTQPVSQQPGGQSYNQYSGRFGQNAETPTQKSYDPFSQNQSTQQSAFDSYPQATQAQNSSQLPSASDYSTYYDRNQYNNQLYGGYGQQASGQETARSATGATDGFSSQASQSQHSQQSQGNRFGDNPAQSQSGHNTPNPPAHQAGQHQQQPHGQQGHAGFQGYQNHPYFNQPYYQAYMNQYGNFGGQSFGGPFGKGGMYNQQPHGHHGYGMPQSSSYDQHSNSPANTSGFGADNSGFRGNALGDYGRSTSAAPAAGNNQQGAAGQGGSAYGNVQDPFGRSPGNTYNQTAGSGQQAAVAGDDSSLKPFDKATIPTGPSGVGQPGRPTSAANNAQGAGNQPGGHQGIGGIHQQQQFGGYPAGLGQGSQQYGGLGQGLGHQAGAGQQSHHQGAGAYGSYSGGGYGTYGSYGRGQAQWGGNYGNQH